MSTWHLHLSVRQNLLDIWTDRGGLLLLWHNLLVGESRGHLLVGIGQIRSRNWGPWLRRCRRCWMCRLGRPRHGAWHQVGGLLGHVGLWSLIALGYLRLLGETVLLMRLKLSRKRLLVLRTNTRLRGDVSMRVNLLGLNGRSRKSWSGLVPLREGLSDGRGVLLWLGHGSLAPALDGSSWLCNHVGVGSDLWNCVSSWGYRWDRGVWRGGVASDRRLNAVYSCGRGPDRSGGNRTWLGSLRRGWPITWNNWLWGHLWRPLRGHVRVGHVRQGSLCRDGPWSRKVSDPCQELRRRQVGREVRKTWSAGPRQGGAAPGFSTRRHEGFRTGQTTTGSGEGVDVRREAAEVFRQVTS